MYPLDDEDRRHGSNCPILMISSEHWNLTKHQAPFRKDLKLSTIDKLTQSKSTHHSHHLDSFRHPFVVTILGSDHLNYCDMMYLSSPLLMTRPNYLGKTNPYHFAAAKDHLILRFFTASSDISDLPVNPFEASPLYGETVTQSNVNSSSGSPQSIVPPADQTDVSRLFQYCQISPKSSSGKQQQYWMNIEPIPLYLVRYLESNLADESSLPHCYDDEYFNQITNQTAP